MSALIPFSRMLVGGCDSQTGKQSGGGEGGYSVFMHVHVCIQAKAMWTHTYTKLRNRQHFISDSCNVNKVGMVNRKSVGWRRDGGERPKAMGSVGAAVR